MTEIIVIQGVVAIILLLVFGIINARLRESVARQRAEYDSLLYTVQRQFDRMNANYKFTRDRTNYIRDQLRDAGIIDMGRLPLEPLNAGRKVEFYTYTASIPSSDDDETLQHED